MAGLLTVIHVLVCIFLVISILLQSSKGGGLAGVFGGGGGMGSVFGGRGAASFLAKVTMWLGVVFAVTSITIALLSKGISSGQRSMIQQVAEQEASSPAAMLPTASGTMEEPNQGIPIESEEPIE
ncbi:preprotein translocase subunit SecG [bacterium]|nr:preprotein translocase subunit SecG [bacterium]RQV92107.1 MAG: preprotein translocase subunit SecG [bacterium]